MLRPAGFDGRDDGDGRGSASPEVAPFHAAKCIDVGLPLGQKADRIAPGSTKRRIAPSERPSQ